MTDTKKRIKEAFERLCEHTEGVRGSALIIEAGADLRNIAERLLRDIEERQSGFTQTNKGLLETIEKLERQVKILEEGLERINISECDCYSGCGPCFNTVTKIAEDTLNQSREARGGEK